MKILLVNDFNEPVGGAETYLFNLRSILQQHGHDVEIFSPNRPVKKYNFIKRFYNFEAKQNFKNFLCIFKPDIVHVNNILAYTTPSILSEATKKSIPIVMTIHDYAIICPTRKMIDYNNKICNHHHFIHCPYCSLRDDNAFGNKILNCMGIARLKLFIYLINKYVDCIIIPSNSLMHFLQIKFPLKKIIYLTNFINISEIELSNIENNKRLIYFGRIVQEKGLMNLIKAMNTIIKRFPDCVLTIIGSGPDFQMLANTSSSLGLENNVKFLGKLEHKMVMKELSRSELSVVPSISSENCPLQVIESMAAGRPIIASDIFGLSDIIDDEIGIKFKHDDIDGLSNAIVELLSNFNLVQRMSVNCRSRAINMHSSDIYYDKLLIIYKDLLSDFDS